MSEVIDAIDFLIERVAYYQEQKQAGARPYGAYYSVPPDCVPILNSAMVSLDCDADVAKSALIDLLREGRKNPAPK